MSPHAPNAFNELATETLGDMKVTGTASFLVICITCVGVGGRVRDLKFLWILLQVFLDNNGCKIGYHVTIIWEKNPVVIFFKYSPTLEKKMCSKKRGCCTKAGLLPNVERTLNIRNT